MRLVVAAAIVLAVTGCGGRRSANACPAARLVAEQGSLVSEKTGQHTLVVQIEDRARACTLDGVPKIELLGRAGAVLHFEYEDTGDLMIPPAHPQPLGIAPGRPALVELNKYRCDIRAVDEARTVRLTLPQMEPLTLNLGTRASLDWCPAEKPSSIVDVSAVYAAPISVSADGRGVLQDVYDGHLDERWSCGSLRAAIARLPEDPPTYSAIPGILARAAAHACDAAVAGLRKGARRADVFGSLGTPDRSAPRCTLWRWQPAGGATDGARVCFAGGRATTIQRAVHG